MTELERAIKACKDPWGIEADTLRPHAQFLAKYVEALHSNMKELERQLCECVSGLHATDKAIESILCRKKVPTNEPAR